MKAILIPVTESLKYPRLSFYYYDDSDYTKLAQDIKDNGWIWKDTKRKIFQEQYLLNGAARDFTTYEFVTNHTKVWVCNTEYYKYSCKLGAIL